MGTGAFVFCGKTCEHADARAALSTQARAAACLQVVCLLPSVVKEQSPFTSLVGLEKNCSHYTSRGSGCTCRGRLVGPARRAGRSSFRPLRPVLADIIGEPPRLPRCGAAGPCALGIDVICIHPASWFFSSYGGILELRRGIQAASCVGPGKSNLPFELRRKAGDCSRVTAGPIDLI